ncbi:uncharacterized protein LOC125652241 [Ostrea edulis]|uniref:uncharacterized protein LOC125652241 n=1 Tax=Ostrea edulis TaxID=37623 RepID=UPI0020947CC7|nr:uncharacterized protein LOC125652241 [Ostrea edulis]
MPVAGGGGTDSLTSSSEDSMAEKGQRDRTPDCAGKDKTLENGDKDDSSNQDTCEKTTKIRTDGKPDDRDYQYQELLSFLYDSLKTEHPELWEQQTTKIRIPAVYCVRKGRKTVLLNFIDICKAGSIDIRNRVCLKGNFKPAGLQTIISKYVKEYVMCASCKSFHTLLIRETLLLFLHCEGCGSRRVVDAVKFGFRAITSRISHR